MSAVPSVAVEGPPAGRGAETARFGRVLAELERGRGSVVEITGEPASGKTWLACVLAELAESRGLPVTWARAPRSGEGLFGAFGASGPAGGETRCDPIVERAAGGVLLVDDLHRADPFSLDLVLRLARAASPAPFVLALVHRPRQSASVLLEALDHGVRTGGVVRVEAGPLDAAAVAALLERWRRPTGPAREGAHGGGADGSSYGGSSYGGGLGGSSYGGGSGGSPYGAGSGGSSYGGVPGGPVVDSAAALYAASGGLPGYLRLLVAARFNPELWPERPGGDDDGLLREAAPLLAELGALTGRSRTAARAAAVLGGAFRAADVALVSGLGARDALEACADLVRADLVRPAGHGGLLAFRHPVVGHVVHADCELPFLLDAHRRALRLTNERGRPAPERARHAEHLVHADGAAAARILAEAAAETLTRAPAAAARWLRLALDAPPDRARAPEERAGERADRELAHCRALIASGDPERARAHAHELLSGGGPRLTPPRLLRAYALCAGAERLLCRYEEAEAIARTGMALLPRPLPAVLSAEATELVFEYGLVHVLRGTHDRIRPLLGEAARARTEAGPAASTALGVLIAFCDVFSGDTARGASAVARHAPLVDALPDGVAGRTPDVLALLGCAELYLERFPDARRHLRRGLDAAAGGAQKHIRAHQLLGLTMIDQWAGRLGEAERHAGEAEELARAVGAPDVVTLATAMRAMTLVWARGRRHTGEAVALAARAVDTVTLGRGWWATSAISLLAHAQLLGGDPAGCLRTLLDGGGGERLPQVQPTFRPSLLALTATAALAGGDAGRAERLLADAEEDAARLGLPLQWACVHRAGAQVRAARGRHEEALELFERAAEGFRGAGLPVQHAWTLVAAAPVAAAVRGPAAAYDLLERAGALARPCGAALVLEEAERVRARLVADTRPGPVGDPADRRSALSEREREVAELAASGLRSRQIAERLFLSHRTVDAHLARTYRKLGVSSRAALARALQPAGSGQETP